MAAVIGASVNAVTISGRIRAQVDEFVREKRIHEARGLWLYRKGKIID